MSNTQSSQLNLENFTSSGNLSSDVSLDVYKKTVDSFSFNGLSFVLFYSKPCCKDEIKVFNDLFNRQQSINNGRPLPLKFFTYESSKGTNSAIFSILEHAPYRIMGFPYIVTFFNGEFCSVFKPNDLPSADKLSDELLNYANKISQKAFCKVQF